MIRNFAKYFPVVFACNAHRLHLRGIEFARSHPEDNIPRAVWNGKAVSIEYATNPILGLIEGRKLLPSKSVFDTIATLHYINTQDIANFEAHLSNASSKFADNFAKQLGVYFCNKLHGQGPLPDIFYLETFNKTFNFKEYTLENGKIHKDR